MDEREDAIQEVVHFQKPFPKDGYQRKILNLYRIVCLNMFCEKLHWCDMFIVGRILQMKALQLV